MTDIVERLRAGTNFYAESSLWYDRDLADAVDEAADEIERLRADNAKLRTVMVAAAEEIQARWDAHCDAEGYGPVNLMRRLEEGIPSHYGYTAGDFERLRLDAARYRWLREQAIDGAPGVPVIAMPNGMKSGYYLNFDTADFAIDAAMKA